MVTVTVAVTVMVTECCISVSLHEMMMSSLLPFFFPRAVKVTVTQHLFGVKANPSIFGRQGL
jgi:hypothetical protein